MLDLLYKRNPSPLTRTVEDGSIFFKKIIKIYNLRQKL